MSSSFRLYVLMLFSYILLNMSGRTKLTAILAISLVLVGVLLWAVSGHTSKNSLPSSSGLNQKLQQQAIAEAKSWKPKGACATVMTPATHVASGATYTFPSGCLPPEWRADSKL